MAILPSDCKCIYLPVYLFGTEERLTEVGHEEKMEPREEPPRRSAGAWQPPGSRGWRGELQPRQVACSANPSPVQPEMFALQGVLVTSRL